MYYVSLTRRLYMAYHHSKRRRPILTIVLCLLAICAVTVAVGYSMLNSKLKKLQQGAEFDFAYTVTCTSAEAPALYTILDTTHTTQGSVYGLYEPGKLLVSLYRLTGTTSTAVYDPENKTLALIPDARESEPFTRVYVSGGETLYDVGQLYSTIRRVIVGEYPITDAVLPQWTLGNYISQTQLATALGVELGTVDMQDMTGFEPLALTAMKPATSENALDGFSYYTLASTSTDPSAPTLVFGLSKKNLFSRTTPLHILLTIPEHSVKVELLGTLSPAEATVSAPTSRMQDSDIETFAQIRQTVEDLMSLAQ